MAPALTVKLQAALCRVMVYSGVETPSPLPIALSSHTEPVLLNFFSFCTLLLLLLNAPN